MSDIKEKIIKALTSKDIDWKHVEGLVCVHTFYRNYYINLCAYDYDDQPVISLNVDNITNNTNDIVDETFQKGSTEYQTLLPIYNKAMETAQKIRSGSSEVFQ